MIWTLRPAVASDAPALSALAMDSKASRGYSAEFMEACRDELTITDRRIADELMTVAQSEDGVVVGFVSVAIDGASADLADLFVAPAAQSAGVGRALWESACRHAIDAGFRLMTVEADPNAVEWYVGRGAVEVGEVPSGSIPGRMLPLLEVDLPGVTAGLSSPPDR